MSLSPAQRLARMPDAERRAFLDSLTDAQARLLLSSWGFSARPEQRPPADAAWSFWLLLGGRGSGKSRPAAEWICDYAEEHPGCRIALVGRTAADHQDTIVDGESGILACARRRGAEATPQWIRSNRQVRWPNGSIATTYSADEPDQLRGPQHHAAWGDEIRAWPDPEAMSNLRLGLRLGTKPRAVFSTSPRGLTIIRDLLTDPACRVSRLRTRDNADNLAPAFLSDIVRRYEGTTLGRVELDGEMLDEAPGALWRRADIDASRVPVAPADLVRVVVAVDPTVGSSKDTDECGIVPVARAADGHVYVLGDDSARLSPAAWARRAIEVYDAQEADALVYEANQGGDAVGELLSMVAAEMTRAGQRPSARVNIQAVHASRGKVTRAEPISALWEQGRAHIVGHLPALEDQCTGWVPGDPSPDRMDAMVWGCTEVADSEPTVIVRAGGVGGERDMYGLSGGSSFYDRGY